MLGGILGARLLHFLRLTADSATEIKGVLWSKLPRSGANYTMSIREAETAPSSSKLFRILTSIDFQWRIEALIPENLDPGPQSSFVKHFEKGTKYH